MQIRHRLMQLVPSVRRRLRPLFPQWLVNYVYHLPIAFLASHMYGNPGRDLEIIGVTGTDGKTTTSTLIYHILKTARKKVALISTVEAKIGRTSIDTGFHVTAPDPFPLQRLLRRIRSQKIRYVVLEATSHGLDQFRFFPIRPQIAVLTNITHEHLDYHRDFAHYRAAKLRLFRRARHAVVNKDLPDFAEINRALPKVLFSTYSVIGGSQLKPENIEYGDDFIRFRLGRLIYKVTLTGQYNLYNTLAAIATALILEIPPSDIQRALISFPGVIGRLEAIPNHRGIHAYVDFAHTPNALNAVLTNLASRKNAAEKLIVVFGSAGERDESKRPLMGAIAAQLADKVVLTAEDPRGTDPVQIAQMILDGAPSATRTKFVVEPDRSKAIELAVNKLAKPGDWIVVCGKGHEQSMNLDGFTEIPWSDQNIMRLALNQKTL